MSSVIDAASIERARQGDRVAVADILGSLQTPLHRLAVSMLWSHQDAEDATQEALIAVMTNLATFRGDCSVETWAYRIAVRLYMRRRRSNTERLGLTFDTFAADLLDGLPASDSVQQVGDPPRGRVEVHDRGEADLGIARRLNQTAPPNERWLR